ncbi:MAG: hypothetical protein ACXVAY_08745 [Mucilaginibacter sp.]
MKLLRPILSYLLFVIILTALPLYIGTIHADWLTPHFWLIFFFICSLTFLVTIMVSAGQQMNAELGGQMFLATTTFKILACLAFVVIYLLKNKVNKYVFVADFFYIYFLNTAFEVYSLLCNLRNQNLR